MIRDNLWICPITPKYQDKAYYSITNNEIIVPGKGAVQIGRIVLRDTVPRDDALHRSECVLDRFKPTAFGSPWNMPVRNWWQS